MDDITVELKLLFDEMNARGVTNNEIYAFARSEVPKMPTSDISAMVGALLCYTKELHRRVPDVILPKWIGQLQRLPDGPDSIEEMME